MENSKISKIFAENIVKKSSNELKALSFAVIQKFFEGHIALNLSDYIKTITDDIKQNIDNSENLINPYLKDQKSINNFKKFILDGLDNEYVACVKNLTETDEIPLKPFVFFNDLVYLHRYFYYETKIIQKLNEFSKIKNDFEKIIPVKSTIKDMLVIDEDTQSLEIEEKIDWQLAAVLSAISGKFTIITGGPGTGKTAVITKILSILLLQDPNAKIAISAPTGKASARINESINNILKNDIIKFEDKGLPEKISLIEARTLYRLLGYKKNSTEFIYNKENPLKYDVIIVDESSMIDAALMAKLFDAIGPNTKLILAGDKNQLSSVEAGSIFGDICIIKEKLNKINTFSKQFKDLFNSITKNKDAFLDETYLEKNNLYLTDKMIELKRNRRFKKNSILKNFSKFVLDGDHKQAIDLVIGNTNKDNNGVHFFDIKEKDENEFKNEFNKQIEKYKYFLQTDDIRKALKKINQLQVICAFNNGTFGVESMNSYIENHLSKVMSEFNPFISNRFYHNQPIMITENDYSLELYNGDTGIIRNEDNNFYFCCLDSKNNVKKIRAQLLKSFSTSFAITIHKSQGSEYENAVIMLPHIKSPIFTRELIYTAVTRVKNNAYIFSTKETFVSALNSKIQRVSGIAERIDK